MTRHDAKRSNNSSSGVASRDVQRPGTATVGRPEGSRSATIAIARAAQDTVWARVRAAITGAVGAAEIAASLAVAQAAQQDILDLLEFALPPDASKAHEGNLPVRRISVGELLGGTRWRSAAKSEDSSDAYIWASVDAILLTLFPCIDRNLAATPSELPTLTVIGPGVEQDERLGLRFRALGAHDPIVALVHAAVQAVIGAGGGSATLDGEAGVTSLTLWFSTALSPPTLLSTKEDPVTDIFLEETATGTLSANDPRYVDVMIAIGQSRNLRRAPPSLLGHVLAEATLVEYAKDTVLMEDGDTDTDEIFLLVRGALEVSKEGKFIATLAEPGDLIGEVAPFSGSPRMARVVATADSELIRLSHRRFAGFRQTHPERYAEFVGLILFSLTGKIRVLTDRVKTYENVVAGPPAEDSLRPIFAVEPPDLERRLREIVLYSHVVASSQDAVIVTDPDGIVVMLNPAARQFFSLPESGSPDVRSADLLPFMASELGALWRGETATVRAEGVLHAADDLGGGVFARAERVVEVTAGAVLMQDRLIAHSILVRDITAYRELTRSLEASREALEMYSKRLEALVMERTQELRKTNANLLQTNDKLTQETREKDFALRKLQETQAFLLQSEKMSALGQLAAGVAHEINNPMGFVYSNLNAFQEYFAALTRVLSLYGELDAASVPAESPAAAKLGEIRTYKLQVDYDYIMRDSPALIADSLDGASRVVAIVQNLKEFSRVDSAKKELANLNAGIESTLKIIWNELKYKAEIEKDFGEIPEIECYPQQLNQVFLNLLVNAAQAIEKFGKITVRTWCEEAGVAVSFTDTGTGIEPDQMSRIFEPFFTTKPVGKGTGLGLSVVYNLVRQHQGRIDVQSKLGIGTTFTIHLPSRFSDETDSIKP